MEAAAPGANWNAACWSFPTAGSKPAPSARSGWPACAGREDGFYDFATKYLEDGAELDVPAKVDDDVADEVRRLAIRAFRAIDCQGLARVDFFLTEDGPVVNEINTMPGFTTISMYPQDVGGQRRGLSDAVAAMVDTALARGTGLR